jgi:competence protein ComFC
LLLGINHDPLLCKACNGKLELIKGEICRICGRSFSLFPEQYRQGDCCNDCIRWEEDDEWSGILVKNHALYVYNDFLKEVIAKLKYRGDAEIIKAFHPPMKRLVKKYDSKHIVVPIPLSKERNYERGFNQAELLAREISSNVQLLLKRSTHEQKQSKKNRQERMKKRENPFEIEETTIIKGVNILLVDDIYTTGSTLRYAAKALINAGARSVSSLTIGR